VEVVKGVEVDISGHSHVVGVVRACLVSEVLWAQATVFDLPVPFD